jgi:hypothetical protein
MIFKSTNSYCPSSVMYTLLLIKPFESENPGKSLDLRTDSKGLLILNDEIIMSYRKIEEMCVIYK